MGSDTPLLLTKWLDLRQFFPNALKTDKVFLLINGILGSSLVNNLCITGCTIHRDASGTKIFI